MSAWGGIFTVGTISEMAGDIYYNKLTTQKFITKTLLELAPGQYEKLFGNGVDKVIFDTYTLFSDKWLDYMTELNSKRYWDMKNSSIFVWLGLLVIITIWLIYYCRSEHEKFSNKDLYSKSLYFRSVLMLVASVVICLIMIVRTCGNVSD